jgi:hypothetical protein
MYKNFDKFMDFIRILITNCYFLYEYTLNS